MNPFGILWSVSAVMYLSLGIYGFRVVKADRALREKRKKESVVRLAIITSSLGCICLMGMSIMFVILSLGIIKGDTTGLVIGLLIFGIMGFSLILFSIIRFTVLSIQAMSLAEAGIVATRQRWLILLQKYAGLAILLIICAVGVLSLVTSNFDTEIYLISVIGAGSAGGVSAGNAFLGFFFGYLSYKFRTLAANQISTNPEYQRINPEQQRILHRCREIHRFTMIVSICLFLAAIVSALLVVMGIAEKFYIAEYLAWTAITPLIALVALIIIRDSSLLTIRNDQNLLHKGALITPLQEPTTSPNTRNNHNVTPKVTHATTALQPATSPKPPTSALAVAGIAITNKDQHYIGMAPLAPRPSWLPTNGTGQANVEPNCWSISLENWVRFVHTCMAQPTWRVLAETKGERNVNMYDINVHFIKPWTRGTGCSVAGLMDDNQRQVDLMVSHAWAGSVIESLASIKTITRMYLVPKETRIFFDTLCMYQAEDGTIGGLSIPEQLTMKPFTTIIHKKPQHGMFIIHTTISEVYERLWCVHEADEAIEAKIEIYGAFDPASWNTKALKDIVTSFSTQSATCQGESDKETLTNLVNDRGGFDRLDRIVKDIRQQSIKDLEAVNLFEQLFSMNISSVETFHDAEV